MGTQEAIYYGVPTIGIPVFSDQIRNVNIMVHKKIGILLRLEDLGERSMDIALNTILRDKYRYIIMIFASIAIFNIIIVECQY